VRQFEERMQQWQQELRNVIRSQAELSEAAGQTQRTQAAMLERLEALTQPPPPQPRPSQPSQAEDKPPLETQPPAEPAAQERRRAHRWA
jgi:hypothetical protein